MNISEEQLKEIREMAGLFFSPEDIALNLELSSTDQEDFENSVLARNVSNPLAAAYFSGRISAQVALRAAIKQSAANGSSPSQQTMLRFMTESEV